MKCSSYHVFIFADLRRGHVSFCERPKGHRGVHHGYEQSSHFHLRDADEEPDKMIRRFWEWDDKQGLVMGIEPGVRRVA